MKKKLIIVILDCAIILLAGSISVFGQKMEVDLKDKKITIQMEQQPLGLVFRHLIGNYDIPIGFEKSTLDIYNIDYQFETNLSGVGQRRILGKDGKLEINIEVERIFEPKNLWITINAENENLENVLNIIVGQMENYKWEINDGVVNIFPIRGRDQRFEKLMETNIENFTFEKGKTVRIITTNIMKLPEFKKFLDENKLKFNGIRVGSDILMVNSYDKELDTEMNFSNLTFRELLNKITKIKRGGWILKSKGIPRSNTEEEHIDIDI